MRVTVAICTFRGIDGVVSALKSLATQAGRDYVAKIIVIDNGADNCERLSRLLENYRSILPGLTIIAEPRIGVSHARNCALDACESELIAYLDDDCIAAFNWIERLRNTFLACSPNVAAVGGRVRLKFNAARPAWFSKELGKYLSELDWGDSRIEITPPRYLVGGNVLYSTDMVKRVGGFTTSLGRVGMALLSNEEIDLCDRICANGCRIIYEPDALVMHEVRNERLTQDWFRKRIFWQAVSDVLFRATRGESDRGGSMCNGETLALSLSHTSVASLWVHQQDCDRFLNQLKQIYAAATVLSGSV